MNFKIEGVINGVALLCVDDGKEKHERSFRTFAGLNAFVNVASCTKAGEGKDL